MKKLISIIFSILALQAFGQDSLLNENLQYAEYLVNNHKTAQAFTTLNEIIETHSKCHKAYYLRAVAYEKDQNHKSAYRDIETAISQQPLNSNYKMLAATILNAQGKYKKAGEMFNSIAQQDNNAYYFAAQSFYQAKEYDRAIVAAKNFLTINTEADSSKLLYAKALSASGDVTEALKIVNTVNTRNADYYMTRGIAYVKGGMNKYAIDDLNMALDINPKLTEIYLWRGLAKYQNGDRKNARLEWENAIKKHEYRAKEYLSKYK